MFQPQKHIFDHTRKYAYEVETFNETFPVLFHEIFQVSQKLQNSSMNESFHRHDECNSCLNGGSISFSVEMCIWVCGISCCHKISIFVHKTAPDCVWYFRYVITVDRWSAQTTLHAVIQREHDICMHPWYFLLWAHCHGSECSDSQRAGNSVSRHGCRETSGGEHWVVAHFYASRRWRSKRRLARMRTNISTAQVHRGVDSLTFFTLNVSSVLTSWASVYRRNKQ